MRHDFTVNNIKTRNGEILCENGDKVSNSGNLFT